MPQKIYQLDAFTQKIFFGNPAAVCPLEAWLPDDVMQKIAMENNLAETAFYVKNENLFEIRWFTPTIEVDLCGHATLAAAWVIFNIENYEGNNIEFNTKNSGELTVTRQEELITLNFPADTLEEVMVSEEMILCFNKKPVSAYKGKTDTMLVFEKEEDIKNAVPSLVHIAALGGRGIIITAPGNEVDFVSRFFAPQAGVNEDPVTGSAHTSLIPYWASFLGKNELLATQLSARKGTLQCKFLNERVEIAGHAKLYLSGEIFMDEQ